MRSINEGFTSCVENPPGRNQRKRLDEMEITTIAGMDARVTLRPASSDEDECPYGTQGGYL